jgi:hypothetical protein
MTGFLDLDIVWCSEQNVPETGSDSNERYALFRIYQAMDKVQECSSSKHTYRITRVADLQH